MIQELLTGGLDLLFPSRKYCYLCDGRLEQDSKAICRSCLLLVAGPRSPVCTCCGRPFHRSGRRDPESALCRECQADAPIFVRARGVGIYRGLLKDAVTRLKFARQAFLAQPLGWLMATRAAQDFPSVDLVVPVPLHRSRQRQRGFNQAALLARTVAGYGRLPLVEENLVKVRPTPPQSSLERRARQANLTGTLTLRSPGQVRGRRVLVVDDVLTTGATACETAAVLQRAGARRVYILVLGIGQPGAGVMRGLNNQ